MTLGQMVKEARLSRGLSCVQAGNLAGCSPACFPRIESDNPKVTYEIAEAICKAFDIDYPLDGFKHVQRKYGYMNNGVMRCKVEKFVNRHDTLAADEKAARELGISYGTYCAYRDTGYLKTFIADQEARQQAEAERKVNVIESNVTGGSKSKPSTRSFEASKI